MLLEEIEDLYFILKEDIHNSFKDIAIENFIKKNKISKGFTISNAYYNYCVHCHKENGVVYTPLEIAKYMVINTIKVEDVLQNPYIKIFDPACGTGNMLLIIFEHLKSLYLENIDIFEEKGIFEEVSIESHILRNNLFGFDIDAVALKVLAIEFYIKAGESFFQNLIYDDFLLVENKIKYDICISNPPYIGHKSIGKEYGQILKNKFSKIYKDKGDALYCFFQEAINTLKKGGKATFITSRYFLEAPSGEELRKILKEYCSIERLVDFYGVRPFKNIGIDPVIVFLKKEYTNNEIIVIKPKDDKISKKSFLKSLLIGDDEKLSIFNVNKNTLNNKGWILRSEEDRAIIKKIEEKSFTSLANICNSFQGIITGCDKAFIVTDEIIDEEGLRDEFEIIKPWIKSSNIHKFNIGVSKKHVIYSDLIENENDYPNSIKYINKMKDKLMLRRECAKGIRKWYQLQWGRKQNIFEGKKIIFPFKASENRFSIDKGSFFSADVYCLTLKKEIPITYEYLVKILNSKIYEFYFKTFGKKLGEDLYEYYPNNLMKLCIPTMMEFNTEEDLYRYFELTDKERRIIELSVNKE